jgi:hypothetical protein
VLLVDPQRYVSHSILFGGHGQARKNHSQHALPLS